MMVFLPFYTIKVYYKRLTDKTGGYDEAHASAE